MNTTSHPTHYAPWSVGALMDPGFLRQAVHDAGDEGFSAGSAPRSPLARWRSAMQAAVHACLHRLDGH